jgi:hypothetical protein
MIKNNNESVNMVIGGPRGIICYICGRPFGTHSIELHLKECIKRWDR